MPHSLLVVSHKRELASQIEAALLAAGVTDATIDHAPSATLATRIIGSNRGQFTAVVVSLTEQDEAIAAIASLRSSGSHIPIFAAALSTAAQSHAAAATHAGASGVFQQVEDLPALLDAHGHERTMAGKKARLVLFAPAQDGAGASTAALHTAALLATKYGVRTILAELDYYSDSVAYRLRLPEVQSLSDLGPDDTWRKAVTHWDRLHLLAAPTSARTLRTRGLPRLTSALTEACEKYDVVVGDLPCNTAVVAPAILKAADRIFVVATAEVTSLYLARRRVLNLVTAGATSEAIKLIVNRDRAGAVDSELALQVTGFSPHWRLPNDFAAASKAETEAGIVDSRSPLGRAYAGLAAEIAGQPDASTPPAATRWSKLMTWR